MDLAHRAACAGSGLTIRHEHRYTRMPDPHGVCMTRRKRELPKQDVTCPGASERQCFLRMRSSGCSWPIGPMGIPGTVTELGA